MNDQIEILGYKTRHFDICKRAVEVFSEIKPTLSKLSEKARQEVLTAVRYQDEAFKIEKTLYDTAAEDQYSDSVEEAFMLFMLSIYSIGKIDAELQLDLIEMFDYIPMHLEQIRHPTKKINPALPEKEVMEEKTVKIKEYGEGRMARASLRKIIMYAGELLAHIRPEDELEGWVQAKISDMDHSIEAVYTYYKFGEKYDLAPKPVHSTNEEHEEEYAPKPPSVQHMCALSVKHDTLGFGMCIPTTHSLNEKGEVHFYDVVFSNGIAKGVPASELTILESKSHMHDY